MFSFVLFYSSGSFVLKLEFQFMIDSKAVARQNLLGGPSSVAEQGHIHIQDVEQFSF